MSDVAFNSGEGKVWIFAGEASGDLYGAHLALELQALRPGLTMQGMGGKEMRAAGVELLVDSTDLAVVGFTEVLKQLPVFKRAFNHLLEAAVAARPDLVVFIDYPGFNLRFARKLKKLGIKMLYYVSPQVWAWGKKRIPEIAGLVTHMLVIFPFETEIYAAHGLKTTFVGHPLVDILGPDEDVERDEDLVLLLPGSRFSEVDRLLKPLFLTACELYRKRPELRFVIPAPHQKVADHLHDLLENLRTGKNRDVPVEVTADETADWLRRGMAGIAASGTVTVQSAILGLPLVVVYKVNPLTYLLGKLLVKVPYFTMVNLVAEEQVFEEFLQNNVTPNVLVPALERILPGGASRAQAIEGIAKAVSRLGAGRNASRAAAEAVLAELGVLL